MKIKEKIVAAIDIGTTKIVAIIGSRNPSGDIDVLGYGKTPSTGVKRGVVLNIEQTVNAIQEAVGIAEEQSGMKIEEAYVGIAGQHIRSVRKRGYTNRDSYDDEISKEDVQKLIEDMYKTPTEIGEEVIHVLPQTFIVDSESGVKDPKGMCGKCLEANFHIVIGQTAAANNIKKCVNRVGIKVKKLILEPLASSEAVLTEDEKEVGVALVDIGGGTTDVAVFYEGTIRHTAVIPFGGNVVTHDIKIGCNILERHAEQLKIAYGSSLADKAQENKEVVIPGINGRPSKKISFKNLSHIIQSRMEEIIAQVCFEIEVSGMSQHLGAGIVLTGGGSLLKNINQLVAYKSGMEVRLGLPTRSITSDIVDEINQPNYSTAIGLVLRGINDENSEGSELVKPIEKQEQKTEEKEQKVVNTKKVNTKKEGKDIKGRVDSFRDKLSDFFGVDDGDM